MVSFYMATGYEMKIERNASRLTHQSRYGKACLKLGAEGEAKETEKKEQIYSTQQLLKFQLN